jgi:hypothetical protein
MKAFVCVCALLFALAIVGNAQDLDTQAFTDQIDSGSPAYRGGSTDDGGASCGNGDWSFSLLTAGTGGLTGANVNYMNNFAGSCSQTGETESPVYDVTSASNVNPDRLWTIPAYPANTRPGATSPNYAVLVGDDGGWNGLSFGEWDDTNYEVKVDVYLRRDTGLIASNNEFVRWGLGVRVQHDAVDATNEEAPVEGAGNLVRPTGCYALLYDSSEGNVYPTKVLQQLTGLSDPWDDIRDRSLINAATATVPVVEFLGSPIAVTQGWHTLGIRCTGSSITFKVDDTSVNVTDSTYTAGRVTLLYRTYSTAANVQAYDHGGYFDNIRSQPAPPPTPTPTAAGFAAVGAEWTIYE